MKHTENTQNLPIEISDEVWDRIHPFLVECPNVYVGDPQHCRVFLSAVLWITKEGATWRALPDAYGKWNAIYRRFSRWADAGVFETLQQHFHADAEVSTVFIDSTIVCANASAAGAPKKRGTRGASPRSQLWRFLNENQSIVERGKYTATYHVDSRATS